MLPCPLFLGLAFVPADLCLRIFKGALDEVSATTPRDQAFVRGVLWGVEQRLRAVALGFAPHAQPCDPWPFACGDGPNALHSTICWLFGISRSVEMMYYQLVMSI